MHSQLKSILMRAGAVLAGLLVFGIAILVMEVGSDIFTAALERAAMQHYDLLHSKTNWPIVPSYKMTGTVVSWAYPACAGIVTMALFWQGWPSAWGRAIIYSILVVLIAPMSWINYAQSDQWLNVWIQAAFNLAMAVFFLMIVYSLREINVKAPDTKAIQSVAILMLTSFGVFLPLFYTSVFLAFEFGMLSHDQIGRIPDKAPLLFAGGAGAVATFLSQLEKIRGRPRAGEKPKSSAKKRSKVL